MPETIRFASHEEMEGDSIARILNPEPESMGKL
jgi:hypothetical protein